MILNLMIISGLKQLLGIGTLSTLYGFSCLSPFIGGEAPIKAQRLSLALFSLLLVGLTAALGVWQLQRLAWKRSILETLEHNITAPITPYENIYVQNEGSSLEGRRVVLQGTLRDEGAYYLINQRKGSILGYRPLQRLQTPGNFDILVLRPWVAHKNPPKAKKVIVTGVLRKSHNSPSFFMPQSDLSKHELLTIHIPDLSTPKDHLLQEYYVDERTDMAEPDFKKRFMSSLNIQNNHASYAITWFSLSIALLLMTFLALRPKKKQA
ncbi:MAG: SURF1 family protein [Candidatus Nucleicultricaceae bacterium]